MNLKQLFNDEDAVSPVIGVILMVAITVILAAVIGTFVLGLGDKVQTTTPQASFSNDFTDGTYTDPTGTEEAADNLTVTHDGGDTIAGSQVSVVVTGSTPVESKSVWDGSDAAANLSGSSEISAGDSVRLGADTVGFDSDGDTTGAGGNELDLNSATVKIVWTSESGDSSATIGKWEGPDA